MRSTKTGRYRQGEQALLEVEGMVSTSRAVLKAVGLKPLKIPMARLKPISMNWEP